MQTPTYIRIQGTGYLSLHSLIPPLQTVLLAFFYHLCMFAYNMALLYLSSIS